MSKRDIIIDDGKESLTDEEFEERLNHAYKLGETLGLERAADHVLGLAVTYFKIKNHDCDELASRLRDISFALQKMANETHPNKDTK